MIRIFLSLLCCTMALSGFTWNGMGHQVVAQIAYDHLSHKAKQECDALLSSSCKKQCHPKLYLSGRFSYYYGLTIKPHWSHCKKERLTQCFVSISTWMDVIKYRNNHQYDALHYIDIPYSSDNSAQPKLTEQNALKAIEHALVVLKSKDSKKTEKALNLRILIHVMGDIHQPMHTITRVSQAFPKGDMGGNLFGLGKNAIAPNLHAYWDRGAGLLIKRKKKQLHNIVYSLESKWSCDEALSYDPIAWVKQSHELAIHEAYAIAPGEIPSFQYQKRVQRIVEKQLFLAGCRLAFLLNAIYV